MPTALSSILGQPALLGNTVGEPLGTAAAGVAATAARSDHVHPLPSNAGDVVGPASATADAVPLFDGTTGKLLKNGVTVPTIQRIAQDIRNATHTFALSNAGGHVIKTNTTAYTWTVPPNSSVAFPIGDAISVVNDGSSGNVTIAQGAGVTIVDGATTGAYTLLPNSGRTLLKIGNDRWRVL